MFVSTSVSSFLLVCANQCAVISTVVERKV